MKSAPRLFLVLIYCLAACCLIACEGGNKESGKVIVSGHEFWMEKDSKNSFSLNVKGKIKNIGPVDLKNIVVTGRCKGCDTIVTAGKWFANRDKELVLPEQKDTISFLGKGKEVEFKFKTIAAYFGSETETTPAAQYPDGLEVYIESFETAE